MVPVSGSPKAPAANPWRARNCAAVVRTYRTIRDSSDSEPSAAPRTSRAPTCSMGNGEATATRSGRPVVSVMPSFVTV